MVDAVAASPYAHQQGALYAEDEWRLTSHASLTLGARYDHHSTFGGNTSPRAYLVLTPSARWTVKGGVSRGFKTPRPVSDSRPTGPAASTSARGPMSTCSASRSTSTRR